MRLLAFTLGALFCFSSASSAFAQISGNYTLSSNQTFTSTSGSTFTIGDRGDTFDLQTFTAIFTGEGAFEIDSRITGSGSVFIDMIDSSQIVRYDSSIGNTYSGLTTVRSGVLSLETHENDNNGIAGDLYIGGGPNQARVSRLDKHNHELIADTSTITVAANGTLEFRRMDTGNSQVHDSQETFRKLILDGGTMLNSSANDRVTTINILSSVQLLSSSVIDLGVATTINIGDVNASPWTPGAMLTIKNWSPEEPIYVGQITPQQLSQIQFEMPNGMFGASQIADGQIIPSVLVPEASAFLFVPLLAGAVFWPELKRRCRKSARDPANTSCRI